MIEIFFILVIAGLVSTSTMTIFEVHFWRRWRIPGILEWHENQVLTSKFKKALKVGNDSYNLCWDILFAFYQ